MNETSSITSILEFGSSNLRLAVYDRINLSEKFFFESKINYLKNKNSDKNHPVFSLIDKVEKSIGQHLNEILLVLDSSNIYSLDYSIMKNFENKKVTNEDINYLINECEQIIKKSNKDQNILHIIVSNINFDGKVLEDYSKISQEVKNVILELKFILISDKDLDFIRKLLLKKHISLSNIFCASYIKSLDKTKNIDSTNYNAFIDIGLKKSSLSILKDNKLLYLNNTHVGGEHITKDISKVLKIDLRNAEAEKIKFSKISKIKNNLKDKTLIKDVINSRLEEIIELLFLDCPLIKNNIFKNDLKVYFIGNGSKVLNQNLLTFGSEFDFIQEMTVIHEKGNECCHGAANHIKDIEKIQPQITSLTLENKGFFEKFFDYFSSK